MQDGWIGQTCTSSIEGVTVTPRSGLFSYQYDIAGFAEEFRGPADLITCQVLYYDDECAAGSLENFYRDVGVVSATDGDGAAITSIAICPVYASCDEYCASGPPGPYVARAEVVRRDVAPLFPGGKGGGQVELAAREPVPDTAPVTNRPSRLTRQAQDNIAPDPGAPLGGRLRQGLLNGVHSRDAMTEQAGTVERLEQ
jgi:hypothetical protein